MAEQLGDQLLVVGCPLGRRNALLGAWTMSETVGRRKPCQIRCGHPLCFEPHGQRGNSDRLLVRPLNDRGDDKGLLGHNVFTGDELARSQAEFGGHTGQVPGVRRAGQIAHTCVPGRTRTTPGTSGGLPARVSGWMSVDHAPACLASRSDRGGRHRGSAPVSTSRVVVSLLLWEGRSQTYVAEQAGHSVATLARHYAGTLRELETEPRIPAAEAIRKAGEQISGTHRGRNPKSVLTESSRIPCSYRSGRCWARTSDLRLVEAAQP